MNDVRVRFRFRFRFRFYLRLKYRDLMDIDFNTKIVWGGA